MAFVKAAKKSDVPTGKVVKIIVSGQEFALINYDGKYFALDGICTHEQCCLGEGSLDGSKLTCPCHGGQFEVESGEAVTLPVIQPVKTYRTRVVGDEIEIET